MGKGGYAEGWMVEVGLGVRFQATVSAPAFHWGRRGEMNQRWTEAWRLDPRFL